MPIRLLQRRRKNSYLHLNTDEEFRSGLVVMPKRNGSIVYNSSSYLNPFVYFEVVTKQLPAGTNQFKFRSLDNLGNISEEVVCPTDIANFTLPPRFLEASIVGSTVTLSWTHSIQGAPDRYAIYATDNVAQNIVRSTEYNGLSTDGTSTSITFNLPDGTYNFTVDAIRNNIKSFNYVTIRIVAPSANDAAPRIINPTDPSNPDLIDIGPLQVFGQNVHLGRLNIQFIWPFGDLAEKFRIYHDSGTGTIDYSNPIEFDRIQNFIQEFTTPRIAFDAEDKTFKYVVRTVTSSGLEDQNTFENEVTLDGQPPPNVSSIQIDTTL